MGGIVSIMTGGVSDLAIDESVNSQLPGRTSGPADAYRHILLSAELTRRYGKVYAKEILNAHELEGFVKEGIDERGKEIDFKDRIHRAYMDVYNNNLGIQIGEKLRNTENGGTWKDVVQAARDVISNGEAYWFPINKWEYNPKIDGTDQRMKSDDPRLNWPPKWTGSSTPMEIPISQPYKERWEKQDISPSSLHREDNDNFVIQKIATSYNQNNLGVQVNELLTKLQSGDPNALAQFVTANSQQLTNLKEQSIQQAETLNKLEQTMTAQAEPAQNIEPETRSTGRSL